MINESLYPILLLIHRISIRNRRKHTVRYINLIWITRLNDLVRMQFQNVLPVHLPNLLRLLDLMHRNPLPATVRPQNIGQSAQQNPHMVL